MPADAGSDVEADIERLYGLPQDDFVVSRDATARRLRAAGDREGARVVAALRRPTVAAAIVNALVRAAPDDVRELAAAADALLEAASARDAEGLREATGRERRVVERLLTAARTVEPDASAAILQRVRETLHAAAIDAEARQEALSGRLTRERVAAGLGPVPEGPLPDRPPSARKEPQSRRRAEQAGRTAGGGGRDEGGADDRLGQAVRPFGTDPRESGATRADQRETRAGRAAEARARRERLREAREARDAARDEARAARATLAEARQEVERLRSALEDAEGVVEEAEEAAGAAEERLAAAEQAVEQARE